MGSTDARHDSVFVLHRLHVDAYTRWHSGGTIWRKVDTRLGHSIDCRIHRIDANGYWSGRCIWIDCIANFDGTRWRYNIPCIECSVGIVGTREGTQQNWIICVRRWTGKNHFQKTWRDTQTRARKSSGIDGNCLVATDKPFDVRKRHVYDTLINWSIGWNNSDLFSFIYGVARAYLWMIL